MGHRWRRGCVVAIATTMPSRFRRLLLPALCSLLLPIPLAGPLPPALAQAGATRNTAFFQKAQKDLPANYYFLYRIVDRLARANGLD